MKLKKMPLKDWKIYAILDDGLFKDRLELLRKFYSLIESPVDVIQLRFKDFSDKGLYRIAVKISSIARNEKASLIINDRPDLALLLCADGVHLGKSDIPASLARKILGRDAIIGLTIRGYSDLKKVNAEKNIDYAAIGPVFYTPLKKELKAIPMDRLGELCKIARKPLVAIGGINKNNVSNVVSQGIKTVAFARYGITEEDTCVKIRELRNRL